MENPGPSSSAAGPLPDAGGPVGEMLSSVVASPRALSSAADMPSPGAVGQEPPPPRPIPGPSRRDRFSFWFGIIGTVGTIIGIALAVYFYKVSKSKPLLTFSVHPLKTELKRPDFDKELGFIYRSKPIGSESITAVQVSIWNAGTQSIRDSDVLDPLRILMPDGSEILSARVKKASRAICGFECLDNREAYESGTCPVKWRILEPGDGAVLQIIYAGDAQHDPTLQGILEGQQEGVVVEEYRLNSDKTVILRTRDSKVWFGLIFTLAAFFISLKLLAEKIKGKTERGRRLNEEREAAQKHLKELNKRSVQSPLAARILDVSALVFAVLTCVVFVSLLLLMLQPPGPPFGW